MRRLRTIFFLEGWQEIPSGRKQNDPKQNATLQEGDDSSGATGDVSAMLCTAGFPLSLIGQPCHQRRGNSARYGWGLYPTACQGAGGVLQAGPRGGLGEVDGRRRAGDGCPKVSYWMSWIIARPLPHCRPAHYSWLVCRRAGVWVWAASREDGERGMARLEAPRALRPRACRPLRGRAGRARGHGGGECPGPSLLWGSPTAGTTVHRTAHPGVGLQPMRRRGLWIDGWKDVMRLCNEIGLGSFHQNHVVGHNFVSLDLSYYINNLK
jgi:hypothetical protein